MSFKFTSFDVTHADTPADAGVGGGGPHASVGERVITAVAVTLAILLVSTVAVLLGMA